MIRSTMAYFLMIGYPLDELFVILFMVILSGYRASYAMNSKNFKIICNNLSENLPFLKSLLCCSWYSCASANKQLVLQAFIFTLILVFM